MSGSLPSKNILVVGPSWVGDMVMAQSLFIYLKQRESDIKIDVVAPDWSLPLIARMPEVRQGIGLSIGHGELRLRQRLQAGRALRKIDYRQAIILPRSLKSALLPFFARVPVRTGYRGEYRYGLINDLRKMPAVLDQTVKRFVALGLPADAAPGQDFGDVCPRPGLKVDTVNQAEKIDALGLDGDGPAISIMPGAEYGPAKQWPVEYYAELVKRFARQGVQSWLLGSSKDRETADNIVRLAGGKGVNLCGRTTLPDAVDLIAHTRLAVSNDSGLMHIAAAVNCPVVAIYGSSSPAYTPPLSDRAIVMYRGIDCSPCFQRQCPYGHYRCLKEITVSDVIQSVQSTGVINIS
ncbi:MAG TPA: lipopolysaccharide heptosyltransferase II [Gammaproteobacteria bacterium]